MARLWAASAANSSESSDSEILPEKRSTSGLKSSDALRPSRPLRTFTTFAIVSASLTVLVSAAVLWCFRSGYILFYGDAQAHLNISRSIIDSKTPGYDQLGTVWLPLL